MLKAYRPSSIKRAIACLWKGVSQNFRTIMGNKSDYGPDIRLCLDVRPTRIHCSTIRIPSHGFRRPCSTSSLLDKTCRLGLTSLTSCSRY